MFYNDYPVNWGEPDSSRIIPSMADNYHMEEVKRESGSPILS